MIDEDHMRKLAQNLHDDVYVVIVSNGAHYVNSWESLPDKKVFI